MRDDRAGVGMSPIVRTVSQLLRPLILVYGMQLVLYGHLTPGGGFSGGVVIACAFVLAVIAEGREVGQRALRLRVAHKLDSVGALMFLALAVLGVTFSGTFFRNFITTPDAAHFKLPSAGTLPLMNIAIGLKVGTSLFLVFMVLAGLHLARGDRDRVAEEGDLE
jgi:multicomponent Na+:H+ antiporter subunit B